MNSKKFWDCNAKFTRFGDVTYFVYIVYLKNYLSENHQNEDGTKTESDVKGFEDNG